MKLFFLTLALVAGPASAQSLPSWAASSPSAASFASDPGGGGGTPPPPPRAPGAVGDTHDPGMPPPPPRAPEPVPVNGGLALLAVAGGVLAVRKLSVGV